MNVTAGDLRLQAGDAAPQLANRAGRLQPTQPIEQLLLVERNWLLWFRDQIIEEQRGGRDQLHDASFVMNTDAHIIQIKHDSCQVVSWH